MGAFPLYELNVRRAGVAPTGPRVADRSRDGSVACAVLVAAMTLLAPPSAEPQQAPDPASGLRVEATLAECYGPGGDEDEDGLDDACELSLARAFAPRLVVARGGCNWDDSASPARLGGGYFFAARRLGPRGVRIVYMPAYHRDCGWSGPKCLLPRVDCGPHAGDSETVIVDVEVTDAGSWATEAIFLSAHCFGRADGDCRWYRQDELDAFEWVDDVRGGAPVIWVAEGRQANYPSSDACDRGHYRIDTCDDNDVRYRFPIDSDRRNVGSRARPIAGSGCVTRTGRGPAATPLGSPTGLDVLECFWSDTPFRGWTARGEGVTPYVRYLEQVGGF